MFKDNNTEDFDLMMKSILNEAQEAVPEHVWEGVSAGLDKAAHRRTVVLWWRRAAVGVAAAAVVAAGVFLNYDGGDEIVRTGDGGEMIAVVEPDVPGTEVLEPGENGAEETGLLAYASETVVAENVRSEMADEATAVPERPDEEAGMNADVVEIGTVDDEVMVGAADNAPAMKINETTEETAEYFPEDWGTDVTAKKRRDVSLVLSGVAGTNNALSQSRLSPMMRPSLTQAPKRTGVEETSVKSSYGIPLSAGVGVKIGLSPRWSVGAGLNYTFLSRQFYGKYTKVDAQGDIESVTSSDISNRQHYIGIPVNFFYDVISNEKISFYAYAGGTVEKCVSDTYSLLNTSINHKEKVPGVQLSADAGIGVEFMLGKHLGLYIDPSVRYYFRNEHQPKSIRTVQPLMLGFEIGLRAKL